MSPEEKVIVTKGDEWQKYILPSDVRIAVKPLGTVTVGTRLEGALVLDLAGGVYRLIDEAGVWHELDYKKIRAALDVATG